MQIFPIGLIRTNSSEICIKIQKFSFKKMHVYECGRSGNDPQDTDAWRVCVQRCLVLPTSSNGTQHLNSKWIWMIKSTGQGNICICQLIVEASIDQGKKLIFTTTRPWVSTLIYPGLNFKISKTYYLCQLKSTCPSSDSCVTERQPNLMYLSCNLHLPVTKLINTAKVLVPSDIGPWAFTGHGLCHLEQRTQTYYYITKE